MTVQYDAQGNIIRPGMGEAIEAASAEAKRKAALQAQMAAQASVNPYETYTNPYTDPTTRESMRKTVTAALTPQVTETIGKVTSGISPYQTGRRSASLMREAYNPMTQALGQMETGMEEKGAGFAAQMGQLGAGYQADLPFRQAALTGLYGGESTEQQKSRLFGEQTTQQQQELARAGLTGIIGGQKTMAGEEAQRSAEEQKQLDIFAQKYGYPNMAALLASQGEDVIRHAGVL